MRKFRETPGEGSQVRQKKVAGRRPEEGSRIRGESSGPQRATAPASCPCYRDARPAAAPAAPGPRSWRLPASESGLQRRQSFGREQR
jgi:hypothetical protein